MTNKTKMSFPPRIIVRGKLQRESSRFIDIFWTPACAGVTVCLFHYLFKHQ